MRPIALSVNDEHVYYPIHSLIHVYHRRTGRLVKRLKAHMAGVQAIAVDEEQAIVYSAAADGEIMRWTTSAVDETDTLPMVDFTQQSIEQSSSRRRDSKELEQAVLRGDNVWTDE